VPLYHNEILAEYDEVLHREKSHFKEKSIQRCVIHMLRNSFKYVNYSNLKKSFSDIKAVYHAPNETAAPSELEKVKEKWGKKYPYAISDWENNWEGVSSFFQSSDDIRRIMYHKHYRRAELPVPEGDKDKKRIPKCQCIEENAVSCQRECDQKMETALPELESGAEPAGRPVWGTVCPLPVKDHEKPERRTP